MPNMVVLLMFVKTVKKSLSITKPPCDETISNVVRKFKETDSVHDFDRSGTTTLCRYRGEH